MGLLQGLTRESPVFAEIVIPSRIIGAGYVGRGVAELAARASHDVTISNSRDPRSLYSVVGTLQRDAPTLTVAAGTAEQAAAFGDMVLIALPLYAYRDLPVAALAGKISNP